MGNDKIDFVVTWVDSSDLAWQQEKAKYSNKLSGDKRETRYRDWDILKYWFRSVEKNAPWVNKVYFVTCGQKPSWLNEKCKKLQIVSHSDYMPSEILPTFNSVPIELYLHKIKGLSEKFVYFNDDMFLNSSITKELFFKSGKPCDSAVLSAITPSGGNDHFSHCLLANTELLEKDYDIHKTIKANPGKWFTLKYCGEQLRTLLLLPWHNLPGIKMHHIPVSYTKSTFKAFWKKHEKELNDASMDKFRNNYKINHWVFRYEQLLSGNFIPRNPKSGKIYVMSSVDDAKEAAIDIEKGKHKMICLNDNCRDEDFEKSKKYIRDAFESRYSNKSMFEK